MRKETLAILVLVTAGCAGPPGDQLGDGVSKPAAERLEEFPFAFDRTLEARPTVCAYSCVLSPNMDEFDLPAPNGTLRALNLTVTWTPSSILSETFRVGFLHRVRGEHAVSGEPLASETSQSPLRIGRAGFNHTLGGNASLQLVVGPLQRQIAGPVYLWGSLEQDYRASGNLTIEVPDAAARTESNASP